jgi:hypothetical protein
MKNKRNEFFPVRRDQELSIMEHTLMNSPRRSVSSLIGLTLGLTLLAWIAFAGTTSLSVFSTRAAAASKSTAPKKASAVRTEFVRPTVTISSSSDLSTFEGLLKRSLRSFKPQGRLLHMPSSGIAPGKVLSLPVDFFSQGDEHSIQFSLRFEPRALELLNAELGPEASSARLHLDYSKAKDGLLGVSLDLPEGQFFQPGNNRLLNVSFDVEETAAKGTLAVDFGDEPVIRNVRDAGSKGLLAGYTSGTVTVAASIEGDVAPRPNGSNDGALTIGDWIQAGRFVAGLDAVDNGSEFQRADCAPRGTSGNGLITLADWVQTGRFTEGLDPSQPAGGPTQPTSLADGIATESASIPAGTQEDAQFRAVRAVNTTFTRGQDNNLVIEFDAQGDENAVGFTLTYNPAHMTFVRAVLGNGVPQPNNPVLNINTAQIGIGNIGMTLGLRGGTNFGVGTKELLVVTFTVPLNGNQNTSIAGFGDTPIARAVVNTNADNVTATFNQGTINFIPTVNAIPTLTSISPNFVVVGGPTFTLIVNGTDFVNGASVRVNGFERATTFVSSSELQANVLASDILETGSLSITAANPPPGGGVSQPLQLLVNNPVPVIGSVSPNLIGVNSGSQALTINGANFVSGVAARWNGSARPTVFVNSNQLTMTIQATDVNTIGTATVTALNPSPGGGVSNGSTVEVIAASAIPRIQALDPTEWATQGGAFTLKVIGTSFAQNSVVRWQGNPRTTTFISTSELQAQITAADVAVEGDFLVSVVNPPPGGGNSNNFVFRVSGQANPAPILSTIAPDSVTSGGPDFLLNLTGNDFIPTSVVQANGQNRQTTFVSSTQLQATIFSTDIATGGVLGIRVFTPLPGGGPSATLPLTVGLGNPAILFLSPNTALAGGQTFTLSVIGSSFTQSAVVRWNGQPRATTFVSGTELSAQILASDIATVGSSLVTVATPPPTGGVSNAVQFNVVASDNPLPHIGSINPTQVITGGPAFSLVVNGTGFFAGSLVRWNGSPRQTTFVSATQITAQIPASDIATVATIAVTVFNSTPGGGTSNSATLVVNNASGNPPVISSITPTTVNSGGQAFTLAVEGAFFTPSSVVQFNSDARPTTFISANQLTATIPESDLVFGGLATINVFNAPPGSGTSNVVTLTILNPVPTLISASPDKLGQNTSGNSAVVLTGTNFAPSVAVQVNGAIRQATRNSATQLTVQITQADKTSLGPLSIVAINPTPGGGASNSVVVLVVQSNFLPRVTSITPDAANAGSSGFTLVVTGSNFATNAVVKFGSHDLQTEFISTSTLAATVTSNDLLLGGNVPVRVFNPEPGGGTSSAIPFAVTSPQPSLASVSPNPVVGTAFSSTITVTGANFVGASVVLFNGSPRQTTFVNTTQLTALLPSTDLVGITSAQITVFTPEPGGGESNPFTLGIVPGVAGAPTITSLDPGAVIAGSAAFTLTVNGTNLFPSSVVQFNGSTRPTTFVNATQLTAAISAADVASIGTAVISVFTAPPGGGVSNGFNFGIVASPPPAPILLSLNPTSAGVGNPFALTVNGANFAATSVVQVNGSARATTFVSGTQLIGQITAADVANPGTLQITVFTPAPGGGTSSPLPLPVTATVNPVPAIVSLSPVSASAGGPAFTLTVEGTGFVGGSVVRWNGINVGTVFVTATQLTAQISASNIASPGNVSVTVFNPPSGGGLSNSLTFGVNAPGPPQQCNTICLKSANYYSRNSNRLPNGLVMIGNYNANAPVQIQTNLPKVKDTLEGGESSLQQLNKEFVAIQISLILSGSSSVGGLQSSPSCYGVQFTPVLLSNGITLTANSTTNDILGQVRASFYEQRTADFAPLAAILALMNGDDPSSTCNRVTGSPGSVGLIEDPIIMRLRRDLEGRGVR